MKKYAIIVAGGAGVRMGGNIPKQFQSLSGKPVLWYSVKSFVEAFEDIHIVLVIAEVYKARAEAVIKEFPQTTFSIATGGETRFHSVKNGLNLVKEKSIVFVHDAVRCLLTTDLIHRCYKTALAEGSSIPVIKSKDSVRLLEGNGNRLVDRNKVMLIQTPQTFSSEILLPAFMTDYKEYFTDEATVVEANGEKIILIEGEENNIKITTPIDFLIAERIIAKQKNEGHI